MASYFQRVLATKVLVDTFIGSHSQVLLNPGQCEWLGLRLQEAVQSARDAFPALPILERFDQLLKDFYLKVKDVEILVGQCCVKPWLTNALLFADIEESFVLKGLELHWFQTLFKFVKQGSETGVWLEGVSKRAMLEKTDEIMVMVRDLEYKASVDRAKLKTNLEEFILRSSTSVTDNSLSHYLLKKLELKSSRSSELGQTAPHVMWAVDPKELVLGKSIGGGASGAKVYETTWLKQRFARKVFNFGDKRVFEQEAALLAALQHPHILPMVCCSIDSQKQNCSLVTELMPDDLHSFMARRPHDAPFSLHAAVDLMLQIAEGMQFLHTKRVVHRDLKSSNILVRPVRDSNSAAEGFVCAKVTDFGLSKTKEQSATRSQLTVNIGTTRWMAPELLGITNSDNSSYSIRVDKLNYPFKVDVYSYAITCYEVLTGHVPYHEVSSHAEIRMRVKEEHLRPELPATCPIGLVTLIVKCWDGDPSRRPSFAKIIKELRHIKGQLLMGTPQKYCWQAC